MQGQQGRAVRAHFWVRSGRETFDGGGASGAVEDFGDGHRGGTWQRRRCGAVLLRAARVPERVADAVAEMIERTTPAAPAIAEFAVSNRAMLSTCRARDVASRLYRRLSSRPCSLRRVFFDFLVQSSRRRPYSLARPIASPRKQTTRRAPSYLASATALRRRRTTRFVS